MSGNQRLLRLLRLKRNRFDLWQFLENSLEIRTSFIQYLHVMSGKIQFSKSIFGKIEGFMGVVLLIQRTREP